MEFRLARAARLAAIAAFCLATVVAGPAAANTQARFTFEDVTDHVYSCGVVGTTQVFGRGMATFTGDGTWIATAIHFTYYGTFVDPASGRTIEGQSHQNLTEADGLVATTGQGFFLRGDGEGLVLYDVGRLVFAPGDGTTQFATPKVIVFDSPDADARIDAAVCGMFA
jgi:hypothetical protein